MNKTSITIIKQKDAAAAAVLKAKNTRETKPAVRMSGEKIEPRSRRKMTETISNWIAEQRENKRSEEISAFRKFFGDDFLAGRAA